MILKKGPRASISSDASLQPVKREPFFMDQRCGLLKADRLMVEIKTFCDVDVPLFSVMCWDFRGHTEVLP